ncbi:MAG: hypothetical protein AUK47_09600 [Deltaproteobacteria bacterium CG2_30_63_29]|nr:MAG: hypothetical protein AUK47_09600 [Deltaproteobacteria bacterium CG2_30_63_29]
MPPSPLGRLLVLVWFAIGLAPAAAWAEEPVRIGVVLPLSGEHAALGEAVTSGLEWATDQLSTPVEWVVRDSEGSDSVAAEAVRELCEDPTIAAIIGPVGVSEAKAAAEQAEALEMPILTLTSAEGIENIGDHVFRLRLSPESQSRALAVFAVNALQRKRLAVFYPDDDYGRACMRAFVDAANAAGADVTTIEAYDPDDSKPDTEAELLSGKKMRKLTTNTSTKKAAESSIQKRRKPSIDFDLLFIPDKAPHVVRSLAFLQLSGVPLGYGGSVQLLGTSAWASGDLGGSDGLAAGAFVSRLFDAEVSDAVLTRVQRFVDRFERRPTELEAQTHDGILLLGEALEVCKPASRGCVTQQLRSGGSVEGITGEVGLTSSGGLSRSIFIFDVDEQGGLWPAY